MRIATLLLLAGLAGAQTELFQTTSLGDLSYATVVGSQGQWLLTQRNDLSGTPWSSTIELWDIASGQRARSVQGTYYLSAQVADLDDDDGEELLVHGYASDMASGLVRVVDIQSGQVEFEETPAGRVGAQAVWHTHGGWCAEGACAPKADLLITTIGTSSGRARLVRLFDPASALAPPATRPEDLRLEAPPAPNPFNPETRLSLVLDQPASLWLDVYNLAGQRVAHREEGVRRGAVSVVWDGLDDAGRPAASGTYTLLARTKEQAVAASVTLLR